MRGMSSTSPCSKSILSTMSPIRLSSRWRAKMTGRCPWLTNLRLLSAPITPMPPVIKIFMSPSVDFCAYGLDQDAPVLQVALNEVGEVSRRKIDALEALGLEELPGFRKVQRFRNIAMDLRNE